MMEETEAAVQILKKGKAPGPNNIDSDLLKEGDEELIEAETTIFRKLGWELWTAWENTAEMPGYMLGSSFYSRAQLFKAS